MSEPLGWKSPFEFRKIDGRWHRRRIGDKRWTALELQTVSRKRGPLTQKWTWR
jgi:hypothetical protein